MMIKRHLPNIHKGRRERGIEIIRNVILLEKVMQHSKDVSFSYLEYR